MSKSLRARVATRSPSSVATRTSRRAKSTATPPEKRTVARSRRLRSRASWARTRAPRTSSEKGLVA